ncbi:MAG: lipopolysaccharide heptosyltransferase II [Candidatus Omnitrophica bacterium]|nr:lipopolysaccharide heptosyltransferase II [Candidatus Omnitrophota bacterium]
MAKNKRILIVEVNWLGDVLFSTPAIRVLKSKYPECYIGALVYKRCKDVLMGNPNVNEIIVLDEQDKHRGFFGKLRLINQLKAKRFDTVYLFHRSFTRTLICLLSGISNRIGYYTAKRRFLLTESVLPPKKVVHRAAYYYYLITKNVPGDIKAFHCDFFVGDGDTSYIKEILEKENIRGNKRLVVIHPAGNWFPKRWPKENFAQLADELIDEFGVVVVFSGASEERNIVTDIISLMKNKAINLCAKITLKQLGALFKRADLVISADSGPLHISVALKRPTVAIFGPTSTAITGPLTKENIAILQKEIDCIIPCYKQDCLDNRCMKQISVKDVIDCIEEKRWLAREK